MDNFTTINILDMNEVVGEDNMISILSDFFCPKNKEIENYIQNLEKIMHHLINKNLHKCKWQEEVF